MVFKRAYIPTFRVDSVRTSEYERNDKNHPFKPFEGQFRFLTILQPEYSRTGVTCTQYQINIYRVKFERWRNSALVTNLRDIRRRTGNFHDFTRNAKKPTQCGFGAREWTGPHGRETTKNVNRTHISGVE